MTTGPILRQMVRLAAPVFVANAFQALHSIVNIFWLGRLSQSTLALNAPIISFQIIFLAASIGIGISQAGTALVGQARGAKQEGMIPLIAGQVVLVISAYFLLVAGVGFLGSRTILNLLNTPPEAYDLVNAYFRIIVVGMVPVSLSFAFRALAQGVGDTKTPMIVDGLGIALNIVLDPILIFVLGFGVEGAAFATVISRLASSIWAFKLLTKSSGDFRLRLQTLVPSTQILQKLLRIGIPAGVAMGSSSLGFAVITRLVASHGAIPVAAFGIASRLFHFFMMPSMAAISAVTTTVAQCLGAGKQQRARKAVRVTLVALPSSLLLPMVFLIVAGGPIAAKFTSDPEVAALAHRILIIASLSPVIFGGQAVLQGAFQGGGVTSYTMLASFLRLWGVRVPFSYLLISRFGLDAIWASMAVSNLVAFVFLAYGYVRGLWERRQI